jgi:hypothetical protein
LNAIVSVTLSIPSTACIANKIRSSSDVLHVHIHYKNNGHFPKELALNIFAQTLHSNILQSKK